MKKFKITFNSPVTLGFIFICFAVLVLDFVTAGLTNQMLFMTYHSSLASPLTYVRFFTHVLGHSGWEHFISNASYILLLGPMLEEKYNSKRLVYVILITAVVTGLVNYVLFPNLTQTELARELHVRHNGVISMYENGKKNLSIEMLIMYSEYFRVTADWILKGEPAMPEDDKGLNGLGGLEEIKKVYLSIRRPEVRQVALRQLRNLAMLG